MKSLLDELSKDPQANGLDEDSNPIRVLIVEDEEFTRDLLVHIFEAVGYEIVGTASNGREGIALYEEKRPRIVSMDINMPEMDGIEATRRILDIDPDARIMMLTALSYMVLLKDALEKGARGFITKPIQKGNLKESLLKLKKVASS